MKDKHNIDFKFMEFVFPFLAPIFLKVRNDATKKTIFGQIVADLGNNNISDLIQIDYLANYLDNPIGLIDGIIDYYKYLQIDFKHKVTQMIEKQAETESFETSKELENLRKVEIERYADKCNNIIDYCNGLKANYKPTQPQQNASSVDNGKRTKETFIDIYKENNQLQTIIRKAENKGLLKFNPNDKSYWLKAEQDFDLFCDEMNKKIPKVSKVSIRRVFLNHKTHNEYKNPSGNNTPYTCENDIKRLFQ